LKRRGTGRRYRARLPHIESCPEAEANKLRSVGALSGRETRALQREFNLENAKDNGLATGSSEVDRGIKDPEIIEVGCEACNGLGSPPVRPADLLGRRIYPAQCKTGSGKGRVAEVNRYRSRRRYHGPGADLSVPHHRPGYQRPLSLAGDPVFTVQEPERCRPADASPERAAWPIAGDGEGIQSQHSVAVSAA
jgi:hypothetical protein